VGQDDGHSAFVAEEVETVQQEGEIRRGFWRQSVIFEAEILT